MILWFRQQAVLEHVLPVFADIISLKNLVDTTVGLERFAHQQQTIPLTTNGLREYQRLYEANGGAVEVNDHVVIGDAIQMVFYPEEVAKRSTLWDLVGQFRGSANADDAAQSNSVSALAGSLSAMMRG